MVGNAEDIISLIDEKGKVIYVSPAFEKATGYTVDYMVGKISVKLCILKIFMTQKYFQRTIVTSGKTLSPSK